MTLAERLAQPDLAGLPDWRAAETLNAPDPTLPTRRVDVPTADARAVLLASGEWPKLVMTGERGSTAPTDLRGLCILVCDTLILTSVLETSRPTRYAAVQSALDRLVAAGLIAAGTRDALLALAERPQSWAEANGVTVDARAVGLARGGV